LAAGVATAPTAPKASDGRGFSSNRNRSDSSSEKGQRESPCSRTRAP
jgi:hypothetical protein